MNTTTRLIGLGTLALAATTLTTPAPATAAPASVNYANTTARWGHYPGNGCTASDNGKSSTVNLTAGKSTANQITGTSRATHTNGAVTDVTTAARGTSSYTTSGGELSSATASANGKVTLAVAANQACNTSAFSALEQEIRFTVSRPKWVTVVVDATARSDAWAGLQAQDGTYRSFYIESDAQGGTVTGTWFLVPGTYVLDAGLGWSHSNKDDEQPVGGNTVSGSGRTRVVLHDAGGASAATAGAAKKYVALGQQASCSTASVPVAFTAYGGKVRSAVFTVNGRKVRSVAKVKAGTRTTVPGLPKHGTAKIGVRLVIDPPGPRKSGVVTAVRSYRACAAR